MDPDLFQAIHNEASRCDPYSLDRLYTRSQLQAFLYHHHLSTSGNKPVMIDRIMRLFGCDIAPYAYPARQRMDDNNNDDDDDRSVDSDLADFIAPEGSVYSESSSSSGESDDETDSTISSRVSGLRRRIHTYGRGYRVGAANYYESSDTSSSSDSNISTESDDGVVEIPPPPHPRPQVVRPLPRRAPLGIRNQDQVERAPIIYYPAARVQVSHVIAMPVQPQIKNNTPICSEVNCLRATVAALALGSAASTAYNYYS